MAFTVVVPPTKIDGLLVVRLFAGVVIAIFNTPVPGAVAAGAVDVVGAEDEPVPAEDEPLLEAVPVLLPGLLDVGADDDVPEPGGVTGGGTGSCAVTVTEAVPLVLQGFEA